MLPMQTMLTSFLCNPETLSTGPYSLSLLLKRYSNIPADYDEADRLYFANLDMETRKSYFS
jgi:hypothetical protein